VRQPRGREEERNWLPVEEVRHGDGAAEVVTVTTRRRDAEVVSHVTVSGVWVCGCGLWLLRVVKKSEERREK